VLVAIPGNSSAQEAQYKGREIGRLTGDTYYARNDDYLSVFMVTPEGIVLVEPISTEVSLWLKGELARRFNVPVKYVIYSHHHWDHASGGSVYADTARFVGHENMLKHLAMPPASTALPQNVRQQDVNANGKLESSEAQGNIRDQFALYDVNKDGALTGAEVTRGPLADVRPPDLTITQPITIHLGGKRVEVIPRPIPHSDDNTIVRFVDGTNTLFASDWVTVHRLNGGAANPEEIPMIAEASAMDFDHFICSHGALGRKSDFMANLKYRQDLKAAVEKAIAAGQTLEQAQTTVTMDTYRTWEAYSNRAQNVANMYRALTRGR
jgi:glyoxylase-like metal-dependent hydrolase (beta-lactamase superfamily II)